MSCSTTKINKQMLVNNLFNKMLKKNFHPESRKPIKEENRSVNHYQTKPDIAKWQIYAAVVFYLKTEKSKQNFEVTYLWNLFSPPPKVYKESVSKMFRLIIIKQNNKFSKLLTFEI